MNSRHAFAGLLLATSLFVGSASADTTSGTARDLNRVVEHRLAEAGLTESVRPFSVAPALVQLRRYVEPGRNVKLVCVIDLALFDRQGALLATVRGNAATPGENRAEAIEAAARAAVSRLPTALQALRERTQEHVAQQ
jgi:hypothetical protein